MRKAPEGGFPDGLVEAHAELRRSLRGMDGPDRHIALDAVRDALDRDAASLSKGAGFIAGTFAVEGVIANGPHFEVVRLRHRDAGTFHALKRPVFEHRANPVLRSLLIDEARHQASVVHPACLPLRCLLRLEDGRPGLVTDFVDSPTLAERLRNGWLGGSGAVALGLRVAEALRAVHGAGLVHGDVSPANLFVPNEEPGVAILFDFGLSRPIESTLGESIDHVGTRSFAAPETREPGSVARASADLYSLGRLLRASLGAVPAGALGRLVEALTTPESSDRPGLDETLQRLQACGAAATDERENASNPETNQPRRL